jgi:hypothetical protein
MAASLCAQPQIAGTESHTTILACQARQVRQESSANVVGTVRHSRKGINAVAVGLVRQRGLSAERARDLLSYDPTTGLLTWRVKPLYRPIKPGDVAGHVMKRGYLTVTIAGQAYYGHRLCWLIHHGEWPDRELDHVNGVRTDNRIENLRPATRSQNSQNRGATAKRNKSGLLGVAWDEQAQKWQVKLTLNGKVTWVGRYSDKGQAAEAYREAKTRLHTFNPVARGES